MPNLQVKKADDTTDIVWTQVQFGGSDASRPAIWQSLTVGTAAAHRPELRYHVRRGARGINEVVLTSQYPTLSVDTTTGVTSVVTRQRKKTVYTIDNNFSQADINEFIMQDARLPIAGANAILMAIRSQVSINS